MYKIFFSIGILFFIGCISTTQFHNPRDLAQITSPECLEQNRVNLSGEEVLSCEKLHEKSPYVRLENTKDEILTSAKVSKLAVGLFPNDWPHGQGSVSLFDRQGTEYFVVNKQKKLVSFDKFNNHIPKSPRFPSYEYIYSLYKATGKVSKMLITDISNEKVNVIQLEELKTSVLISGCAIDSHLLGVWEAKASRRFKTPQGTSFAKKAFDSKLENQVSLLIEIDQIEQKWVEEGMPDWKGDGHLENHQGYLLKGKILNMTKDITRNGKTYPSLKKLKEASPFYKATDDTIEIYRHTNMHGQAYDDHWALKYPSSSSDITNMGMSRRLQFLNPTMLFSLNPDKLAETINGKMENNYTAAIIKPHLPHNNNGHEVIFFNKLESYTANCPASAE